LKKIIELRNKLFYLVCSHALSLSWQILCSYVSIAFRFFSGSDNNFGVINKKDIDPPPLDLLSRVGQPILSCYYMMVMHLHYS
ncbi:hypothetical protein ZWY2020_060054, partial [Hordeum vulgare]